MSRPAREAARRRTPASRRNTGTPPGRTNAAHPQRRRDGRWPAAIAAAGLATLSSCGTCLLVQRRDAELRTRAGEVIPVRVEYRTEDGVLMSEPTGRRLLLGFLLEPLDWFVSTGAAWEAMVSDDTDVLLGPLGWLWTLTPFATLFPTPEPAVRTWAKVDDATLARLRLGDVEAARQSFGDWRIRALTFR